MLMHILRTADRSHRRTYEKLYSYNRLGIRFGLRVYTVMEVVTLSIHIIDEDDAWMI